MHPSMKGIQVCSKKGDNLKITLTTFKKIVVSRSCEPILTNLCTKYILAWVDACRWGFKFAHKQRSIPLLKGRKLLHIQFYAGAIFEMLFLNLRASGYNDICSSIATCHCIKKQEVTVLNSNIIEVQKNA